jgi:hypothetical protein
MRRLAAGKWKEDRAVITMAITITKSGRSRTSNAYFHA